MSKRSKATRLHSIGAPLRGQGVIVEREHDAYRADHKLPEPSVCRQCRASYHAGRWQWTVAPAGAQETLCPACRRTNDDFPAGYVAIEGAYFGEHRDELMRLIEHRAERARAEHPMQRIIAVQDQPDGLLVTTTDTHLARGIAEGLHHAHQGDLSLRYEEGQTLLRARWKR